MLVGAEPVHIENSWKLGRIGLLADLEPVREVIAHVIAAEGEHGHRVAPQLAHLAGRRRGGFAAGRRAQESAVLPIESLRHERYDSCPPSAEKNRVNRDTLGVLPL